MEDAGPPDAVSDPQGRPLDSQNAGVARGYLVGGCRGNRWRRATNPKARGSIPLGRTISRRVFALSSTPRGEGRAEGVPAEQLTMDDDEHWMGLALEEASRAAATPTA